MATVIPAKLRPADISRFALRATQLEKLKPVVAYWCNYWILKQIIEKGLQNADNESLHYTTQLMDRIERTKSENQDDTILDDVAAKLYIEQFGLETFQRADNAVRANKASRQTADTFLAAATFLELCQIWGELDPEVSAKIKFAKYHAIRIAKAVKVGEDPNLSNPVQEPEEEQPGLALDLNDPEVQALNGSGEPTPEKQTRQPSVVEVPDEHDQLQRNLARKSLLDESIHPSRASSVPRPSEPQHHATPPPPAPISLPPDDESFYHQVASNTENGGLPSAPQMDRTMSAGGGYFPEVPDVAHPSPPPGLPSAPSFHPSSLPGPYIPDVPSLPPGSESPVSPQLPTFPGTTMPPPAPPGAPQAPSPFPQPHSNYAPQPPAPAPYPPSNQSFNATPGPGPNTWSQPPVQYQAPPQAYPPQRTAQPPPAVASPTNIVVDEAAIAKAQKHARWAISALNFEDINTAIRELRGALQTLGAQ